MQSQINSTLNPLQLELLKHFSFGLNKDDDLINIKRILSGYFANKITTEMDRFWKDNKYSDEILDEWLKEKS